MVVGAGVGCETNTAKIGLLQTVGYGDDSSRKMCTWYDPGDNGQSCDPPSSGSEARRGKTRIVGDQGGVAARIEGSITRWTRGCLSKKLWLLLSF